MAQNVEIKARATDLRKQLARATAMTDLPVHILEQTDTFFHTGHGRLKLRRFGDGQAELIGYDRPNTTGPKLSRYQRMPVPDPDTLLKLLQTHHGILGEVVKQRHVVIIEQTRVHFDRVRNLGQFIELEVVMQPNQSESEGRETANQLMGHLNIMPSQLIPVAYIDLLLAQ